MVKKYVYQLGDYPCPPAAASAAEARETAALEAKNDALHATLEMCKNQITRHHANHKWDHCKKYTNEYELVFTSSSDLPGLSSLSPISRSFFKLWELLHDFRADLLCADAEKMRAAFLAEGPGGFMEAFAHFREAAGGGQADELHGMTLQPHGAQPPARAAPSWRLPSQLLRTGGYALHHGCDGTGNLYSVANVDHLAAEVGPGSCHLVTADGGFDFSSNFNSQEEVSTRLVACEVLAALALQRAGGAFVLKVYDMQTRATVRILHALRACYGCVRLVKPLTSRPANSEKYVVCTGFLGAGSPAAAAATAALRRACLSGGSPQAVVRELEALGQLPAAFMRDVVEFNTVYIARQVCYISRTLLLIKEDAAEVPQRTPLSDRVRCQLQKSLRWCHKYNVPVSLAAVRRYAVGAGAHG